MLNADGQIAKDMHERISSAAILLWPLRVIGMNGDHVTQTRQCLNLVPAADCKSRE